MNFTVLSFEEMIVIVLMMEPVFSSKCEAENLLG